MQSLLPSDNPYYTIVQLIQNLILLYFRVIINSKILTDEEQTKLFQMVNNHFKDERVADWKLLFRASRDGFHRNAFYEKCDKIPSTICIIQTPQNNVFGGFTKVKWDKSRGGHSKDASAFVYSLRSDGQLKAEFFPVVEPSKDAIQYYENGYLSFGSYGKAFYFYQESDKNLRGYATDVASPSYDLKQYQFNGHANYRYKPTEIEVFQVIRIKTQNKNF